MNIIPFLVGYVTLKSDLSIEHVAEILSERIFGGLKFGGKEEAIYEEVPAIYISSLLGLRVVLSGYQGHGDDEGYCLSISPTIKLNELMPSEVQIDLYLVTVLKQALKDYEEIEVLDVDINRR